MGTPSISMGHLYHSYVSLPEGTCCFLWWFHLASQRDPTGRIRCTPPGIKAWLKPCGWARWESTPFRKAPKLMWKPLETHGNSYKFINILGICVSPPKKNSKNWGPHRTMSIYIIYISWENHLHGPLFVGFMWNLGAVPHSTSHDFQCVFLFVKISVESRRLWPMLRWFHVWWGMVSQPWGEGKTV